MIKYVKNTGKKKRKQKFKMNIYFYAKWISHLRYSKMFEKSKHTCHNIIARTFFFNKFKQLIKYKTINIIYGKRISDH